MDIKKTHIVGFIFIVIVGSLMHFAYKWSGENIWVSFIAPVNESPWEHLKLLFWPALMYMVAEFFIYGKYSKSFFAVKMTSILSGLMFILIFFYTYSGILGFNLLVLDILDFFLAVALYFYLSCYMLQNYSDGSFSDSLKGIVVLFLVAVCFVVWTNSPPDLGVFWG